MGACVCVGGGGAGAGWGRVVRIFVIFVHVTRKQMLFERNRILLALFCET